jgi:hypothetical protein
MKKVFLHAIHENFEVQASIQAGTSTENDTLFDNEEINPIGMSNTRLIQIHQYIDLETH